MAVVKPNKPMRSNLDGPNGVMAHIINPARTGDGRLVSSSYERTGTDYDTLAGPILEDNESSPKGIQKNSHLAYRIKLSFSPDDPVIPEQVHEPGAEFAHHITSGEYKFVVATHTDHHHLHDRTMVYAVSRYGKHLKVELPKDIIRQWRVIANEISERERLSVIFNPTTGRVACKMRGGETTPNEDPTTQARDPKHVEETPEPGTVATARTTRRAEDGEPVERRYGMLMEEIYAFAEGLDVRDQLRMLIGLTLAGAGNFEDQRSMLGVQGVNVTVRGQHFTFTMKDTDFKVRDTKLGLAYDMTNIMAELQDTPTISIMFNRRLVAKQAKKTVTMWLPDTHRKKKITFNTKRLVDDGESALRAFLPLRRGQIVLDPSDQYTGKTTTHGPYQWFGEPTNRLEPLASPERLPLRYGVGPTQRRYYQTQARRLDRLAGEAKALNAAIRWTRLTDGNSTKGLELLRGKARESYDELQAAVIALHGTTQQGDLNLVIGTRDEMERREALCSRYGGELAAIKREIHTTRDHEQTETEQRGQYQHRCGRSI